MKPSDRSKGTKAHSRMMTRLTGIAFLLFLSLWSHGQGGDQQLRAKAEALYQEARYAEAMPLYSQLVSLYPADRTLNQRFGTTLLFVGEDKEKAIGHLKYATEDPGIDAAAWYWLGRAYHLNYRFQEALTAYQRYRGVADRKTLAELPAEAYEQQCRNGMKLLSKLKDITVRNKVEVAEAEFFRFYDLSDIGGRIVVTPDELKTALDKKSKQRGLVVLPDKGGPIYFSSYGKDGRTGLDIYRTELLTDGKFATPEKLAGFINTEFDDDFAFMHPDGRTFYFSSKGHSSMGGYDVFKATYDKGMDAFGRPENMDFAVNTPDDDILYMVDAEQKEACFASGRSSRQGQLHVYRVSTDQVPLVITVLQGTYANEFDAADRKARIVVEDALTREQVADVRTDINGSYVLALPRSGKYRFLVDCGPSGKTHSGMVDVPRSDGPKAYRQELTLTRQGDQERLVIRNYFDEPLEGDLIAMALDEIKRRARLDVSAQKPAIAQEPAREEAPGDVLTEAGFSGDLEREDVIRLAQEDAAELAQEVDRLEDIAAGAFALALASVSEAEQATREAEQLVAQAAGSADEEKRNDTMVQAAMQRQRAREAELRAQAAYRTGQQAAQERLATQQKALEAERLATQVAATLTARRDREAMPHLTALKERLDAKSGPTGRMDMVERTRRAVAEQEKEAQRTLNAANALRADENELTDRANRLRREMETTRNRARTEELEREVAEYDRQLEALRRETEQAFAKAKVSERETAVARGSHSLTRYLDAGSGSLPGTVLEDEQVADLQHRIAGTRSRTEALAIDERFDARIPLRAQDAEARSFAWETPASAVWAEALREATRSAERDARDDAQTMAGRTTEVGTGEADRDVLAATQQSASDTAEDGVSPATVTPQRTSQQERSQEGSAADLAARDAAAGTSQGSTEGARAQPASGAATDGVDTEETAATTPAGTEDTEDVLAAENRATEANDTAPPSAGGRERDGEPQEDGGDASDLAERGMNSQEGSADQRRDEEDTRSNVAERTQDTRTGTGDRSIDPFLIENEIAELRQVLSAERNKARRDSLQQRITELDQQLMIREAELLADREQQAETPADRVEEAAGEDIAALIRDPAAMADRGRAPMVFDPEVEEDTLVAALYQAHAADEQRLMGVLDPDERAAGLHGLELMLADSIRSEMARQVAILELDPQQADRVLPRVDRLRRLREDRLARADAYLQARQEELLATATAGAPAVDRARTMPASRPARPGADPIEDRFIVIEADPKEVYASTVVHRASGIAEAVAQKEADVARMEELQDRIDSMMTRIDAMPVNRERDKEMKRMDRLRDDLLILRSDVGQRSAFLAREEWTAATDSLKSVEKELVRKGLPPTEPLLVMQRGMRADAQQLIDEARDLRRKADRTEDILQRDSLYRRAYETELRGLREMDRSLTVANYLLSDQHQRGETLAYTTVASRLLGTPEQEDLLAAGGPERSSTGTLRTPETAGADEMEVPVKLTGEEDLGDALPEVAAAARTVPDQQDREPAGTEDRIESEDRTSDSDLLATDQPGNEGAATTGDGQLMRPAAGEQAEATLEQARAAAEALARAEEARLDEKFRVPADTYERYLGEGTSATGDPRTIDDGSALALEMVQAAERAAELEQRSVELGDRATALQDSAATARKRDRVKLEALAVRTRTEADSLRTLAVRSAEQAREAEVALRDQQEEESLRRRLVKFYYLSGDEQEMVVDDSDRSRYFGARTKALEQYDAAADADEAARTNREIGDVLKRSADQALADEAAGTQAERVERARILNARADALLLRADSLDDVARRLRGAAAINEAQASVMLQGMPEAEATELMALEMRGRRTEPILAEARGQAGAQPVAPVQAATPERSAPEAIAAPLPSPEAASAIPERLTADIFELRPVGDRVAAPILLDAPMPEGIVFKVQIGAFRKAVPEETFSDMTPVMGERLDNGLTRYTAGLFTTFDQAASAKDKVRGRGYRDAFVVAYRDGRRIPLGEAMREVGILAAAAPAADRRSPEARPSGDGQEPLQRPDATVAEPNAGAGTQARPDAAPVERSVQEERAAVVPTPVTATIERPSVVDAPAPTPEEEQAMILAKYPVSSAGELVDTFVPAPEAGDYYNVPGAAPARQVETIKGLFFTVQVGVYSRPVALDKLFRITPLNSERTATGKIRYTTGVYLDMEEARTRKDATVQLGVKDAFVTAYLNGKRIPVREATVLLERFGPGILARP